MSARRIQLLAAAGLLLATALAGVAARGLGRAPAPRPLAGPTTFTAPTGGPVSFSGTLDRSAVLLGHDGLVRIELAIAAKVDEPTRYARQPTDVVIILDRSGSMGGEKIEQARAAVRGLLGQLGDQDRFALVTYSDDATVTIPLSAVGDRQRAAWLETVAAIQAAGGTNMSSGLDRGLDLIEHARVDGRVPHVILISDGLANQGDPTREGLTRRAERAAEGEFMLTTVGVGADFDEDLMTDLADAGTGNYYYVQDSQDLEAVFAREFDAARTTVANGVSVHIEPGPGVRVLDVAGYPLTPVGDGVTFRPGSIFAGQQRRVWVTLAVSQQAVGEYDLGRFSLAYGDAEQRTTLSFSEVPRIACVRGENEFYAGIDADAWGRSVVVDSYNKMQEEVARAVKAGERDQALEHLRKFKDETAAMNSRVQSPPVAARLRGVDALADQVSEAFEGPGQAARQNQLSKSVGAEAVDARRAGSKK
jgi:Ca-activated chloride channel homolog